MASCSCCGAQLIPCCAAPLAAYALFGRFLPRLEAAVETRRPLFLSPGERASKVDLSRPAGNRVDASTLARLSERFSVPSCRLPRRSEWGKRPGETPQSTGERDEQGIGDGRVRLHRRTLHPAI